MSIFWEKINWKWIAVGGLVLLVAFGIYNNPDRKTAKIDSELQEIFSAINSTLQNVAQAAVKNQSCFGDESLRGGSADCVINLRDIQNTFRSADKENVAKLEAYYQKNQSDLDGETKKMIEESLRLYNSSAYSDLMAAYDQFFTAYIEWHKYFRDYVGIKGVDNLSSKEIMQSKSLAEDVVAAEENLELKKNALNDFLHENFDTEFITALNSLAEDFKQYMDSLKWTQVSSPSGELTMDFPAGFEFEEHNSSGSIPGYSYLVYTQGETGTIAYAVKYENYEKTFADSNISYFSVEQRQAFLKQLAESLKDDLGKGVSNFSTKPGSVREYSTIKFNGDLSSGTQRGKFEGYIVLVGRTSYTLSAIYNEGSKTDFDRILESFALRSDPNLKFSSFLDLSAFEN